ncbi:tRNA (adenosine(37)-N6)-dimethylallyltransferase MiaA [Pedobacter heparinus]|uniref:tRNA (adenosine(37)-N6)-dimethylallyltransferase MiaA n=1 Tax=Pedobacter heparinus TaxID=984 RepID=UPI00292FCB55|nr:tRNA (adenosine(37)-N6)-dimethylallyltransferase MiaA [Pedobacter heparinus]
MPAMAPDKTLIVIVGPTGIGKTALAISLARQFSTEIISADSRQFFREMEIGTAKPSAAELTAAHHHFINSHSIQTFFSTGDFELQAIDLINHLFRKHELLVMVGGSGLYIDAVCNGLDELPETDLNIREKLNQQLATEGLEPIKRQLSVADPEYYQKVDQANPQRLIRGLEFYLSTGKKLSTHFTNNKKIRPFNIIKIGLNINRAELYNRINHRVDKMMEAGLLDEVKSLQPFRKYNALNTVGYAELFSHLDGEMTLTAAVDQIKQNTRRFAKRQLTWFRRDNSITWFEPGQDNAVISYIIEKKD